MGVPDRKEILRIDCSTCHGNGFVRTHSGEEPCSVCGGVGMRERQVPWKPEGYSRSEIAREFGVQNFTNSRDKDDPANVD